MLMLPSQVKVFLARQPTDLRKSIDGLALLARQVIQEDPLSGHLFVFVNKVGHRVKILFWDRTGYVIWYKRLESARIRLPLSDAASLELTATQLALLLDGVTGRRARSKGNSAAAS
jgi:transposase